MYAPSSAVSTDKSLNAITQSIKSLPCVFQATTRSVTHDLANCQRLAFKDSNLEDPCKAVRTSSGSGFLPAGGYMFVWNSRKEIDEQ